MAGRAVRLPPVNAPRSRARGRAGDGIGRWLLRPEIGVAGAPPLAKLPAGYSATMILPRPAGTIWRVMASMM